MDTLNCRRFTDEGYVAPTPPPLMNLSDLITNFRSQFGERAKYLSDVDITRVCINALFPRTNFALEAVAPGLGPIILRREEAPELFEHCVHVARVDHGDDVANMVLRQGVASFGFSFFKEYFDIMMNIMRELPLEENRELAQDIVAGRLLQCVTEGASLPLAINRSGICVSSFQRRELTLGVESVSTPRTAAYSRGVLIVGCGLNSAREVLNYPIGEDFPPLILSDSDPHVVGVLARLSRGLGKSNIRVDEGPMQDIKMRPGSIDLVIASHIVGMENWREFLLNTKHFLAPGGQILVLDDTKRGKDFDGIASSSGFNFRVLDRISYPMMSTFQCTPELLGKPNSEILDHMIGMAMLGGRTTKRASLFRFTQKGG